ncbi:tRNA uracil-5-methyltransferase-like protein, partial [Leptotrombidium deliense]
RENYNDGYGPPEKRFDRQRQFNQQRNDFNRSQYRENYNEGYGPSEKRFDRQRQFNQQRNDFNRSQYRENYNEGYGPPEKRFEHRKQFDISHRQLNDLNMKKQFPKSKFKPESDDPYDKLFDNEDPNSDCLLLPNPYNLTKDNQSTIVNEIISPWYKYSYDHQLTIIQNQTADCLRFLGSKITKVSPQFRLTDRGYPCYLDPTVGSTETVEYRSRSEFSIWPGLDGDPKTVGYLAGKPNKHESVVCVEPDGALVLKKSHIKLTKLFQDYLRTKSPLEVCLNFSDGKNWRNLIVRSNDNGDHMVIAVLHPQNMTEEELESEKERIRNYFEPLAEEYRIKSFYLQTNNGSASNFQLVFGMPVIEESLGSMKFVISPSSYFYVNKSGGEQLSKTVLKMLDLSQFQTVLDVSVGTGLLSLQTAPFVKKVIGAEPSDLNFGYACKNIELNNLTNVSIHNIKMQDLLLQQKDELWDKEVVVIANPQQDGFQSSILPQLRSMECVKRVVYITPRPPLKDSKSLRNLFQLMIPERRNIGIEGAPFVAINAVPYDIMPHNPHFGVIVNLERQSRFNY